MDGVIEFALLLGLLSLQDRGSPRWPIVPADPEDCSSNLKTLIQKKEENDYLSFISHVRQLQLLVISYSSWIIGHED